MRPLSYTSLLIGALAAGLLASPLQADPSDSEAASQHKYDLGQPGPYAAGFTHYVTIDRSRPGDGGQYRHRPIAVYVWYPVDRRTIRPKTPEAIYPLDPLYGKAPESRSTHWETYGLDPAYRQVHPSADAPFPLLVFSPGAFSLPTRSISLGTRLASHGFVVAVPYHFGDGTLGEPTDPSIAVQMRTMLYHRPRDLSYVLTDLLRRNRKPSNLIEGTIRPGQVAAGGFSLGGYAAMALAGGDDDVCDLPDNVMTAGILDADPPAELCEPTRPDRRFKAIVPRDGSSQFLHFRELRRIRVPAMGLGEEWTTLELQGVASWQARQHAALSERPAYRIDVFNTNHLSFEDLCEDIQVAVDLGLMTKEEGDAHYQALCVGVTPAAVVHDLVNKYTLAFLKTYLTHERGYAHLLTPQWALKKEQYVEFFDRERVPARWIKADWPLDTVYFAHQPGTQVHE